MNWNTRNRATSYLRSSLWIIPIVAVILEQIAAGIIRGLDARLSLRGAEIGLDGAKALCGAVITFALSFIVFTFGSLLVAIQVASGQYTPRIIATTLLRDNVIRYTVGGFVFTLLFAIQALNRIEANVPQLVLVITGVLGIGCLIAFLFLIDYAARMLRPVSLVKRLGDAELKVLASVYPQKINNSPGIQPALLDAGPVQRTLLHRGTPGIVLAVNIPRLKAEAERTNGVIEFAPQVGDFVSTDEPLFLLHGGAATVDDNILQGSVILGIERTMEQDPLFGFRILVDIAIKALSAAINDPTTAVLSLDQLHRLLRSAGRRDLRADSIVDADGRLRVIFRTPGWDDFVHLACCEIRFYGASNVQIARRLRAMLFNLGNTLPAERHAALRQELELLDAMLEKLYLLPADLALARIADSQGLGGSTLTTEPKWAD